MATDATAASEQPFLVELVEDMRRQRDKIAAERDSYRSARAKLLDFLNKAIDELDPAMMRARIIDLREDAIKLRAEVQ